MAEVPANGPSGPTIIETGEALVYVNVVREALGKPTLDELPRGEPNSACFCVLARSWNAVLYYDIPDDGASDDAASDLPVPVTAMVRIGADDGGSDADTKKAAAALDLKTKKIGGVLRMIMPAEHPLLVWMWAFDTHKLPDLIGPTPAAT